MARLASSPESLEPMTATALRNYLRKYPELREPRSFRCENLSDIDLSHKDLTGSDFRGATFHRGQKMQSARLNDCRFGPKLEGYPRVRLSQVVLREANLERAILQDVVLEDCDLRNANLMNADLSDSDCQGTDFSGAHMIGVNLADANLYGARFNETRLQRSCLKSGLLQTDRSRWQRWCQAHKFRDDSESTRLSQAHQIFMELKENFRSLGAYADASWAYQSERKMKRKMHWPFIAHKCFEADFPQERLRRFFFWAKHTFQYGLDLTVEIFTGYGESLGLTVLWTLMLAVVVFPLLYAVAGGVEVVSHDQSGISTSAELADLVRFSVGSFIQDYAGMEASGEMARSLQLLQEVLGNIILGFIGFILANKVNKQ